MNGDNKMKTLVYTMPTNNWDAKAKCIFNGEVPHLLRAGDMIVVKDGFCVETVNYV